MNAYPKIGLLPTFLSIVEITRYFGNHESFYFEKIGTPLFFVNIWEMGW